MEPASHQGRARGLPHTPLQPLRNGHCLGSRAGRPGRGSAASLGGGSRPSLFLGQLHLWGRSTPASPREGGHIWSPGGAGLGKVGPSWLPACPGGWSSPPQWGAGMGGQPQIPRLGGGGLHWFCVFCGSGETEPGDHASLTDDVLCGQRGRACRQVGGPLKGIVSADRSGCPCGLHLLRVPGAVLNAPIHEAGTAGDTEAGG